MSTPASSQRRIWSIVAFASSVGVLVMVWTLIGASPPTGTEPTMICRDLTPLDISPGTDGHGGAYRRSRRPRQSRLAARFAPTYLAVLTGVDGIRWGRPMAKLARLPANDGAPGASGGGPARCRAPRPAITPSSATATRTKSWPTGSTASWSNSGSRSTLAGQLTENGVVPKRLTPIFRDRHELAAAGDLGDEIQAGARRVAIPDRAVLADRGKVALDQRRDRDVQAQPARRLRAGRDRRGRAVRQRRLPGREAEECFPPALRQKYRPPRPPDGQAGRAAGGRPSRERRRAAPGIPQARRGDARGRARRARPARDHAPASPPRDSRRRFAGRNGDHQHAGDHRVPGARRSARPAPRGGRAWSDSCSAILGQARADRRLDVLDAVGARVLAYYQQQDKASSADDALASGRRR